MMTHRTAQLWLFLLFMTFLLIVLCFYLETAPTIAKQLEQDNDNDYSTFRITTTDRSESSDEGNLPISVVNHVKTFVFFLGHARSGHSIVGSLLDSHPHMVISHEANLFSQLSTGSVALEKSAIFNVLWENTIRVKLDNGLRSITQNRKGYTLYVDGLYQGKYMDYIDVIGDKKGGTTTAMLCKQPEKWSNVFNILNSLVDSVKVIHCIRNPYDNIATAILYSLTSGVHWKSQTSNKTFQDDPDKVKKEIEKYFVYYKAIEDAKKTYNLDIIEMHNRDLINDPRGTLLSICNSLGVTCSDHYLEVCSNKVFKSKSKTRHMIEWSSEQLEMIQQNIGKYSNLEGYTFDS